jgi:hypothetical protein
MKNPISALTVFVLMLAGSMSAGEEHASERVAKNVPDSKLSAGSGREIGRLHILFQTRRAKCVLEAGQDCKQDGARSEGDRLPSFDTSPATQLASETFFHLLGHRALAIPAKAIHAGAYEKWAPTCWAAQNSS